MPAMPNRPAPDCTAAGHGDTFHPAGDGARRGTNPESLVNELIAPDHPVMEVRVPTGRSEDVRLC